MTRNQDQMDQDQGHSWEDFFKSSGYREYRLALTALIDRKIAHLVRSNDEVESAALKVEIRTLVWIRDTLPLNLSRSVGVTQPEAHGSMYDA